MRIRSASDIGTLARQRRLDLGLSQHELATRAGVTRQWLVRFEKGNTEVALAKAFAILRELDLTVRADPIGTPELSTSPIRHRYAIPTAEPRSAVSDETLLAEVREKIAALDAADADSAERGE